MVETFKPETALKGLGNFAPTILLRIGDAQQKTEVAIDFRANEWAFFLNGKLISRTPLDAKTRKSLVHNRKERFQPNADIQRLLEKPAR